MDRVERDVKRELGRFGPVLGMAPLVEAWPGAVGPEIARNAWPARIARDGTLHVHTQDSIWAFELTTRAWHSLRALCPSLHRRPRRRFAAVHPSRLGSTLRKLSHSRD